MNNTVATTRALFLECPSNIVIACIVCVVKSAGPVHKSSGLYLCTVEVYFVCVEV